MWWTAPDIVIILDILSDTIMVVAEDVMLQVNTALERKVAHVTSELLLCEEKLKVRKQQPRHRPRYCPIWSQSSETYSTLSTSNRPLKWWSDSDSWRVLRSAASSQLYYLLPDIICCFSILQGSHIMKSCTSQSWNKLLPFYTYYYILSEMVTTLINVCSDVLCDRNP